MLVYLHVMIDSGVEQEWAWVDTEDRTSEPQHYHLWGLLGTGVTWDNEGWLICVCQVHSENIIRGIEISNEPTVEGESSAITWQLWAVLQMTS